MITCKIYTNDGNGHFHGFDQYAELTMVHSFQLPDHMAEIRYQGPGTDDDVNYPDGLDHIYAELNRDEPISLWAKQYRHKHLRSLSIGDVVTLGETAWTVQGIGFRKLSTDEFKKAIIWDEELKGCPK